MSYVLYDGDCPFCSNLSNKISSLIDDSDILFFTFNSFEGRELIAKYEIKNIDSVIYIDNQENSKTIEVENGLSVMEGAVQNNIPGIDADCGGSMACATCHVYVEEKWFDKLPKAEDGEVDMIDMAIEPKKNSRLSCQLIVSDELDGLIITTPSKQS